MPPFPQAECKGEVWGVSPLDPDHSNCENVDPILALKFNYLILKTLFIHCDGLKDAFFMTIRVVRLVA